MNQKSKMLLSQVLNWILALVGGCVLVYFFVDLRGFLSAYFGDWPVLYFTSVTNKEGKLFLLYLGSLITGTVAAILTAFLTVFILGFLFRDQAFRFGTLTGMFGVALLLVIAIELSRDSNSAFLYKAPGFLVVDVLTWMILIAFSGIASVLGHKTRGKISKFYQRLK